MELSNIIFSSFLLFFFYFISKYSLFVLNKSKKNLLVDNQFRKPQAFHEKPTHRLGGLIIFLALILLFLYSYVYLNILYIEYISFCSLFFLLGFVDEKKYESSFG